MDMGDTKSTKPPLGRMKGQAPPPPSAPQPAPRRIFRNAVPDGGGPPGGDSKENILRPSVELLITPPEGHQTTCTVDGRKALMDLLVDLCSQYHLNPAHHTLELLSPEAQPISFKPNALLGALDVSCAIIKGKVAEERVARRPPPKVPEKTVRLVVNYHRSQKAVVRVNPLVPLQSLVPVICEKCDFDPRHVLLLKDNVSNHELELDKSLTDLGIRELYVLDQSLVLLPKMASAPALNYSADSLRSSTLSVSSPEKKGLLSLFRINRRKAKGEHSSDMDDVDECMFQSADEYANGMSTVASSSYVEARPSTLGQSQSVMNLSRTSPKVEPKKRRAPAPPPAPPQLAHSATLAFQTLDPGCPRSENLQKKRKAPVPPPTPTSATPSTPSTPEALPVRAARSAAPAEDSTSELSHSTEDSEAAGSLCSSSSSAAAVETAPSSLADEAMPELEPEGQLTSSSTPELEPEGQLTSSSTPEEELPSSTLSEAANSDLSLKMEEVENNRHSAIGSSRATPLKPRRSPLHEPRPSVIHPPSPTEHPSQHASLDSPTDMAPQSWLDSTRDCRLERTAELEAETVSVGSSGSFADQGYAASEGMAEDLGRVSSPSDHTQPTSPEDTLSLDCSSALPSVLPRECSSDSDEGCATWGSRHSGGIRHGRQSIKRQGSFEEDPDLTAQLHLTLADLDADLSDGNHSNEVSLCDNDEIPVSILDVDVPVTTIDEVPDDERHSMSGNEAVSLCSTQNITRHDLNRSFLPSGDLQNKSNGACMADSQSTVRVTVATQQRSLDRKTSSSEKNKEESITIAQSKAKAELQKPTSPKKAAVPERPQNVLESRLTNSRQNVPQGNPKPNSVISSQGKEIAKEEAVSTRHIQNHITPNPVSRFGMKTFTVVPPKPIVYQTQTSAGPLVVDAIKIDEQGNMVRKRQVTTGKDPQSRSSGQAGNTESPFVGEAKSFRSSTERQEVAATNQAVTLKTHKSEAPKFTPVISPVEMSEKPNYEETSREVLRIPYDSSSALVSNPSVSESVENPAQLFNISEQKRDLSFLKPARRTSSQYVASAISKYNTKPAAKADSVQISPESMVVQKPPTAKDLKHDVRSLNTIVENRDLHTNANISTPKETKRMSFTVDPKCAQSCPSHIAKEVVSSEVKQNSGTRHSALYDRAGTWSPDSSPVNSKPQVRAQRAISPELAPCSPKLASPIRKTPQESSRVCRPMESVPVPLAKNPEASNPSELLEPNQVSVFGPVKKFKPVICKTVQKETSLHSSLMDAIQSGEGKERLKKISDAASKSALKRPTYVEAENEHSALLSAIRAQNNTLRLRKTKSEAAEELEQFRKAAEVKTVQSDSAPPPPSFAPPVPPFAPPPPPTIPSKPKLVLAPGGNPEHARNALLDAIRSGSGAERLRRVPIPTKTVQVNGRLGTIHGNPSFSQGH